MHYLIGGIEVELHSSTPLWTSRALRTVNRQLDGFQHEGDANLPANYKINLFDYATLPVNTKEAINIVPDYCFFAAGIYVDLQNQIAIQRANNTLNVWCSERCKGLSIPFLIQILLISQGKTFVHAAGIDVKGRGILLAAFGGIGKTAFISQATKLQDVKVLGDDLVIVTENGTMEPYLRPFTLYSYHQQLFPDFFSRYPIEFRPLTLSWRIYNRIRQTIGEIFHLDWHQPQHIVRTGYIPVSPKKVLSADSLASLPSKLDLIYILNRTTRVEEIAIQPIEPEESVQFLLNVIHHELHNQLRFWFSWLTHTKRSISDVISEVKLILETAVSSTDTQYMVQIPANLSVHEVGKELVKVVIK